jgi:hypothetical protein
MTVIDYTPAVHYDWTDQHDMARATRNVAGDEQMRMECKCGKVSRWTGSYSRLLDACNRHANTATR